MTQRHSNPQLDDKLLETLINDTIDSIMDHFREDDIGDLDKDQLCHVALACFAVARTAAIHAMDTDTAQHWFLHMVDSHWEDPPMVAGHGA